MYNFGSNEPETAHASQTAAVNPSYIDAIIRSNEAFAKQQHDDQLLHKKGIEHELSSVSTAKVNERDLGYFGSQQQELNDLAYKAAENPQDMMAQSDFYRKANQISMEADLSRANRMVENQHKEEMLRKGLEKYYLEEQNLLNQGLGSYGNLASKLTSAGLNINNLVAIPQATTTTTQQPTPQSTKQVKEMSTGSVAVLVNPPAKNKAKVGVLFGGTYKQSRAKK